jgi:hypothetical protein
MKTSEKCAAVMAAIAQVQAKAAPVAKSGFNTFDKYAYSTLEDIVATLRPHTAEAGLVVLFDVAKCEPTTRKTKSGAEEQVVRVEMVLRIVHNTSGEYVELMVVGEGQDRMDKAVYKAITGARKYALACAFGLASTDDPENDDSKPSSSSPGTATKAPADKAPPRQPAVVLATPVRVAELERMVKIAKVGGDVIEKWLKASGDAESFAAMPAKNVEACIKRCVEIVNANSKKAA